MTRSEATDLIKSGIYPADMPQTWADLGAGNGLFSQALATQLANGSVIYPIDTAAVVKTITSPTSGVSIKPIQMDMTSAELNVRFDGVLMANSMHFVQDQQAFLLKWVNALKPGGRILVVEYDLTEPNPWVPFPISFNALVKLATSVGCREISRLAEKPSLYNHSVIYSALMQC